MVPPKSVGDTRGELKDLAPIQNAQATGEVHMGKMVINM